MAVIQLNLLPDVKKEFLSAQRMRNIVISVCIFVGGGAIAALLILSAVLGGQLIQKNLLNSDIDKDAAAIKTAESKQQLNEYLTVQSQLSQIDTLKSESPILSRLMDYLKQINPSAPNSVSLSSVRLDTGSDPNGDGSSSITMEGRTGSYATLNVFKNTLERTTIKYTKSGDKEPTSEPLFSSVTVRDAALGDDSNGDGAVSFTVVLAYNEAAFASDSTDISLTTPKETISDASENAPKTVFSGDDTKSTAESQTDNTEGGE
jgi:hypothetical protein